jgi:Fe-S-cluster-containing dehydrogenase component
VDAGQVPLCVSQCSGKARFFGDLDDPNSEVSQRLLKAGDNVHSLTDVGNHPSVKYILSRATWRS